MVKKALTAGSLIVACCVLPAGAQPASPVELDGTAEAGAPTITSGNDSQMLDDLVYTAVSTLSGCVTWSIPGSYIYDYCADDNGCTLRLVKNLRTSFSNSFVPVPPESFAIDSDDGTWSVSRHDEVDGLSYVSGIHRNGAEATIVGVRHYLVSLDCRFFDDYVIENPPLFFWGFGLEACVIEYGESVRCTLTIED